ncbi:unnamed protein product [Leptidea sinapis]|uniref:SAM domain-containing protein n=1 Tax=Leptidea sinapis TaxID=189913 RepID=A0A5E4Q390_9NEOP|nr:unnamed protein product [Leptidea sinapis]
MGKTNVDGDNNPTSPESDPAKLLEAALQQMDGIIAEAGGTNDAEDRVRRLEVDKENLQLQVQLSEVRLRVAERGLMERAPPVPDTSPLTRPAPPRTPPANYGRQIERNTHMYSSLPRSSVLPTMTEARVAFGKHNMVVARGRGHSSLGFEVYVSPARAWLSNSDKGVMAAASSNTIEKELGIKHPMHKKKIMLALTDLLGGHGDPLLTAAGRLDTAWTLRWLEDVGACGARAAAAEAALDARMLHRLTHHELHVHLRVTHALHALSIKRGIQVLRDNKFNPETMIRRAAEGEVMPVGTEVESDGGFGNPGELARWSSHRVPKKSQFSLKRKKSKEEAELGDLVCPLHDDTSDDDSKISGGSRRVGCLSPA